MTVTAQQTEVITCVHHYRFDPVGDDGFSKGTCLKCGCVVYQPANYGIAIKELPRAAYRGKGLKNK